MYLLGVNHSRMLLGWCSLQVKNPPCSGRGGMPSLRVFRCFSLWHWSKEPLKEHKWIETDLGWVGREVLFCCGATSASVWIKISVSHWCYCVLLQGHSSYITHLDWSPDNKYIMSNSGDYEILYCKYEMKYTGNRSMYWLSEYLEDCVWSGLRKMLTDKGTSLNLCNLICWCYSELCIT